MGLFDFFKKKQQQPEVNPAPQSEVKPEAQPAANNKPALYPYISRYNEYMVAFAGMQQQGNYAPIAAYEKDNGEITGFLFLLKDNNYSLTIEEAVTAMKQKFEQKLADGTALSYVILYHSQFAGDGNHAVATDGDEFRAISVSYRFKNGPAGAVALPYSFKNEDELVYHGFADFSREENSAIFNTQMTDGKDYFQEKEEVNAPETENAAGLKIKTWTSGNLADTWGGIFGFESYRKPNGSDHLNNFFAYALINAPVYKDGDVQVHEVPFTDIIFRVVTYKVQPQTILPVVSTSRRLPVENIEICEWQHVNDLEAMITGRGRDTFRVTYFATDYAQNRERYHTQKNLDVSIAGIVLVLDRYTPDPDSEIKYSEDFTAYMPTSGFDHMGYFDFIGELEDFRETGLMNDNSLKGYIMQVRLITNSDEKDFFTIDMYVTPENMRFSTLEKGMKMTGCFQMQGQLAD